MPFLSTYKSQRFVEKIATPFLNISNHRNNASSNGKILILLTSCISPDPNQRFSVVNDPDKRLREYLDALSFYLSKTNERILFIDNSGYDISSIPYLKSHILSGRLEALYYIPDENTRLKGKGFGEQDIIRYARDNSVFWKDANYIIKITGRLKILNIGHCIRKTKKQIQYKREALIANKNWKANWIYSMCFIASKRFFDNTFFSNMRKCNEGYETLYAFEEALADTIIDNENIIYKNVLFPFMVSGIRGMYNDPYLTHTPREIIKCLISYLKHHRQI